MMELSQALARSTSMLAQQPHPFQAFIGLSKEGHFSFRGLVSGGHLSGQGLVVGDSVRPETYGRCKNLHIGISFRACWTSDEDPVSSRDAPCRSPNVTCQQQTLERPSQYCMGLEVAARHACNDARIVNARAREGFVLIARGFERLDRRARQDVALLGSGFLKLDARAREETVKLDIDARRNAARLQSMATDLRDEASAQLKTAAEKHWSDGALDADLRLADLRAKRRAMEDAYMALQLVKNIHNGMAERAYKRQNEFNNIHGLSQESSLGSRDTSPPPVDPGGKLMFDRLTALQDAYWDIASALSEADGIDYSDPEELELIIATLLDMDAVDGASSATMLAECAKSPDVATRQALANALGNAPSLWALGNAGMGALQRLAEDVNPAVAAAASKALEELRKQWQMDSDNSFTLRADGTFLESLYSSEDGEDEN
ncbi:hypothetical protein GOP47_0021505 [Adiantum capillus-veneris]|uniref:Uncharacterized protein n=1 Tax=Adiantum capillus-veneris TaxID=13818 RepID=A0A9D4U8I4_ADICA|nr:hypothetical protein GOP47_0021505 [Adiantum capillus-veneris]